MFEKKNNFIAKNDKENALILITFNSSSFIIQ
jgi:hypothetical protein